MDNKEKTIYELSLLNLKIEHNNEFKELYDLIFSVCEDLKMDIWPNYISYNSYHKILKLYKKFNDNIVFYEFLSVMIKFYKKASLINRFLLLFEFMYGSFLFYVPFSNIDSLITLKRYKKIMESNIHEKINIK